MLLVTVAMIVSTATIATPEQILQGKQSNSECKNQESRVLWPPQKINEPSVQLIGFSNSNLSEADSSEVEDEVEAGDEEVQQESEEAVASDEAAVAQPASNASTAAEAVGGEGVAGPAPSDDCYETVMQEPCREGYMDGGFSRMSPGTMNELKWCCR